MSKRIRNVLIFIIILSVIVSLAILSKINSRLTVNPPEYAGNTGGNLYNRGLFTEDNTYIYFANPADNFHLYRMDKDLENITLLHKDSVEFLNVDSEGSVYYSRINYRMNTMGSSAFDMLSTGIYRYNPKKSKLTRLYRNLCGAVLLAGNNLFFQVHGSDGSYDLYAVATDKDRAKEVLITNDFILPLSYRDGLMYYSGVGSDHALYTYAPSTGATAKFAEIDCYLPVATADGVYFLSQKHDYSLFYLPNNSDTAELITEERLSTYNISTDGTRLFYQVDGGNNNRLCSYDLSAKKEATIVEGDFRNLNTVADYLFFTNFDETVCYCYQISSGTLTTFMPTAENETK